nr:helix-turn-helix domain-containing protein [Streptomyces yangpuensis]
MSAKLPYVEHNPAIREEAVLLLRRGVTNRVVAEHLGIPRGTVGWWRHEDRRQRGEVYVQPTDCPRCTTRELDRPAYAYLLGLYLGDGHIISKYKQHHLSIFCNASQPGLIDAAEEAMHRVMPQPKVGRRRQHGCVEVKSYTWHWTCLFPQHGPGKKHERRIVLEDWQQEIVDAHPWEFLRGLIHSDGCRVTNWTVRNGKRYEYPRYFFTNKSDDIRKLCTDTLAKVGVRWTVLARGSDPFNVSIARKDCVALMDAHIGPKY